MEDYPRWFTEEMLPHETSLRSYLRHSLHSPADVDDAMQETYSRFLTIRRTTGVAAPRQLLFQIARNLVRDIFRRNRRSKTDSLEETAGRDVLDEAPDASERACREDEIAHLLFAVNSLPPRCRQVLVLRKFNGMPQKEIATLLGISESTVESLVVTGARKIADRLRATGIDRGSAR